MLYGMERPGLEGNTPVIEVLEGQTSVVELLAELGSAWHPGPEIAAGAKENTPDGAFTQPSLF